MADNWVNLLCDPKDYELNVIWECLNSVYFTDEQGMMAHRRLLMKYRRQVVKQIHGGDIDPKDLECGTLEHYNDVLKKRRQQEKEKKLNAQLSEDMRENQRILDEADLDYLQNTIGRIG